MKKIFIVLGCIAFTSCGVSSSAVKKTVAIEKDCPRDQVEILEREKGYGRATYKVSACGNTYIYKVIGTTISEGKE